jgi:predicted enzyme related to lactoylglutathione lyase
MIDSGGGRGARPTFFKITLRTTGVDAARSFYTSLFGIAAELLDVAPLHEEAIARGARPHWLGFLDVGDVDRAVAAFRERGATPLGPKWVNAEGLEAAYVRDPGGAIVALARPPADAHLPSSTASHVSWHQLNTPDVERAKATYGALFGWEFTEPRDFGPLGSFHPFAWQRDGTTVGSMFDIGGRPEIHPHWLFHFRVANIDSAMEAVRAAGGVVVADVVPPTGERIAVCDDPQGAAFAIRQEAGS